MGMTIERCCGWLPSATLEGPHRDIAVLTCPICGRRVELGLVRRAQLYKGAYIDNPSLPENIDKWNKGVKKNGG